MICQRCCDLCCLKVVLLFGCVGLVVVLLLRCVVVLWCCSIVVLNCCCVVLLFCYLPFVFACLFACLCVFGCLFVWLVDWLCVVAFDLFVVWFDVLPCCSWVTLLRCSFLV